MGGCAFVPRAKPSGRGTPRGVDTIPAADPRVESTDGVSSMLFRRLFVIMLVVIGGVLFTCDRLVAKASSGRIYTSIADVPSDSTAVILGTSKFFHGRPNVFYDTRIRAAIDLYRAGKISHILLSGAGRSPEGNEPEQMRQDLLAAGIPNNDLLLDPNGTRTIASVINAHSIFHFEHPLFVSQRFHIERAIYLALGESLDASGFAAADAPAPWRQLIRVREVLSRAAAVAERLNGAPIFSRKQPHTP